MQTLNIEGLVFGGVDEGVNDGDGVCDGVDVDSADDAVGCGSDDGGGDGDVGGGVSGDVCGACGGCGGGVADQLVLVGGDGGEDCLGEDPRLVAHLDTSLHIGQTK